MLALNTYKCYTLSYTYIDACTHTYTYTHTHTHTHTHIHTHTHTHTHTHMDIYFSLHTHKGHTPTLYAHLQT